MTLRMASLNGAACAAYHDPATGEPDGSDSQPAFAEASGGSR
jgi:hypothetical protein